MLVGISDVEGVKEGKDAVLMVDEAVVERWGEEGKPKSCKLEGKASKLICRWEIEDEAVFEWKGKVFSWKTTFLERKTGLVLRSYNFHHLIPKGYPRKIHYLVHGSNFDLFWVSFEDRLGIQKL